MNRLRRFRLLILLGICAFWTALVLLGQPFPNVPFISAPWRSEQAFEDLLRKEGRKTATRPDFVFLGIDQSTLELPPLAPEEIANNRAFQLMTARPYPWSREVWSILLDKLFAAGARTVMFDLLFNNPNDGDAAFGAALAKYRDRVVLGANIDVANTDQITFPNGMLIPPPPENDRRVGFVNYWPDPIDGKVRSVVYQTSERQLAGQEPYPGDEMIASFDARGLQQMGRAADVPHDQVAHMIRFSEVNAYPPRTLYEVFDPRFWQANYGNGAFFKDKVVIIGAASQIAHDVVVTPMSPATPGPSLHLESMAAALAQEFVRATPPNLMLLLVSLAGACAWLLLAFVRRPLSALLLLVAIALLYLVIARVAYDRSGLAAPDGSGAGGLSAQRRLLVRLRIRHRATGETPHPPHARALRLEKPGEGNPR